MTSKPDAVVLYNLFRYTRVRDLLKMINRNKLLQRKLKDSSLLWRELLESKPLRDLLFEAVIEWEGFSIIPTINSIRISNAAIEMYHIVTQRRSKQQFYNRDLAPLFLFIWTAFPHIYLNADRVLQTMETIPTFFLANTYFKKQTFKSVAENVPQMTLANFDYRQFEIAYFHVDFSEFGVPHMIVRADNLAKGPRVWPRMVFKVNDKLYVPGSSFGIVDFPIDILPIEDYPLQYDFVLIYDRLGYLRHIEQSNTKFSAQNIVPYIFTVTTLRFRADTRRLRGYGTTMLINWSEQEGIFHLSDIPVYIHTEALRSRPGARRLEAPICLQCGSDATEQIQDAPQLTFCSEACMLVHYHNT